MDIGECGVCERWAAGTRLPSGIAGRMERHRWTTLFAFDARRRPAGCAKSAERVIVGSGCEKRLNENKMSDGGRDRALLGVEVWKSS